MPANSLIVGVDLAPIKPIPRTITCQSDITTDKCRATIRQHFKTWKADTVLHDGAPNVGTAWVQDAFSQAELVLQALKLATEFLVDGGTFVTKVFRSKDYNALLWVFNQLFNKVEATKPPSSRNVSAEIFIVCRGFKAPKRIDPKFLDPRSVFAELTEPTPNNEAKVFNPEKKKRKRDGYEEGNYIQFKEAPASDFIQTADPIAMLGSLNKLHFNQDKDEDIALVALDLLADTTPEIRQCCADLKVLGRKEFRMLLRWRLKARERFGFGSKKKTGEEEEGEEVAVVTPMDEELQIQEELQNLNDHEMSRKKRDKRRENERKQREITRMQMHMMAPSEIGLEQSGPNGEDSVFALKIVDRMGAIEKFTHARMATSIRSQTPQEYNSADSENGTDYEEDRLDMDLDTLYAQYKERKSDSDAKFRAKKSRTECNDEDWEGFSEKEHSVSEDSEGNEENSSEDDENPPSPISLTHAQNYSITENDGLSKRASLFFDQDIFKDIDVIETEDIDDIFVDTHGLNKSVVNNNTIPRPERSLAGGEFVVRSPKAGITHQIPVNANIQLSRHESDLDGASDHADGRSFEAAEEDGGNRWEQHTTNRQNDRFSIHSCSFSFMN